MGQVALGFRSLLYKIAVFVTMAALLAWILGGTAVGAGMLAWILGGTLFPSAVTAIQTPTLNTGGSTWAWQVVIAPERQDMIWQLVRLEDADWVIVPDGGPFDTVMPLELTPSVEGDVLFTLHASKRGAGFVELKVHVDGTVGPPQPASVATD